MSAHRVAVRAGARVYIPVERPREVGDPLVPQLCQVLDDESRALDIVGPHTIDSVDTSRHANKPLRTEQLHEVGVWQKSSGRDHNVGTGADKVLQFAPVLGTVRVSDRDDQIDAVVLGNLANALVDLCRDGQTQVSEEQSHRPWRAARKACRVSVGHIPQSSSAREDALSGLGAHSFCTAVRNRHERLRYAHIGGDVSLRHSHEPLATARGT